MCVAPKRWSKYTTPIDHYSFSSHKHVARKKITPHFLMLHWGCWDLANFTIVSSIHRVLFELQGSFGSRIVMLHLLFYFNQLFQLWCRLHISTSSCVLCRCVFQPALGCLSYTDISYHNITQVSFSIAVSTFRRDSNPPWLSVPPTWIRKQALSHQATTAGLSNFVIFL